jgi:hypothetical protein
MNFGKAESKNLISECRRSGVAGAIQFDAGTMIITGTMIIAGNL